VLTDRSLHPPGLFALRLGGWRSRPLVAGLDAALEGQRHPGKYRLLVLPHRIQVYLLKGIACQVSNHHKNRMFCLC